MATLTNLCPAPYGGATTPEAWPATTANATSALVEGVGHDEVPVGTSYQRATVVNAGASLGLRTPIGPARPSMPTGASVWLRASLGNLVRVRLDATVGGASTGPYTMTDVTPTPGAWTPVALTASLIATAGVDGVRLSVFYVGTSPVGTTLDLVGALVVEGVAVPPFFDGTREVAVPRFDVAASGAPVLATPYAWDGTPATAVEVAP